jgi:signal transduction histidine kinase/ActR/RegA family two-component response regulator
MAIETVSVIDRQHRPWPPMRCTTAIAGMVLTVGCVLAVVVWSVLTARERFEARRHFEQLNARAVAEIKGRLEHFGHGLLRARGTFFLSQNMTAPELAAYCQSRLETEFVGAYGFGLLAPRAGSTTGDVVVARYYSLSPDEPPIDLRGSDWPVIVAGVKRAAASGEMVLSGTLPDTSRRLQRPIVLALMRLSPDSVPSGSAFAHWCVFMPVDIGRALRGLDESLVGLVDVDVYDGDSPVASRMYFDNDGAVELDTGRGVDLYTRRTWTMRSVMDVGDHTFCLVTSTQPAFDRLFAGDDAAFAAALFVMASLMGAYVAWNAGRARDRAAALAHEMTHDLAHARDQAEAANRAKSQFLMNMSHELRTPLTAVLGYADLLSLPPAARPPEFEPGHAVRVIRAAGEHVLTIINDMLDLSRIEADKLTLHPVPVSVEAVVREATELVRAGADARGLALRCAIAPDAPDLLTVDELRLKQILVNLLANAVKFTPAGSVTLEVAPVAGPAGPALAFDVIDTGEGISSEGATKLFHAFSQVDASTRRRHGGVGLGLALSRKLARMMGGDLTLTRSAPGEGSQFRVLLPLAGAASRPQQPAPDRVTSDRPGPLRGRILLAEDGPENQRLIAMLLRHAGAEVTISPNGRDALERIGHARAAGTPFDLLLTDIQMPEMDGFELTRRLRALRISMPIIALTAHSSAQDRADCLQAGCDDFATKPVDRAALTDVCARWLNRPAAVPVPAAAAA